MGEYSNLFIGGRHITGWKNCVGTEASILFTEDDFTSAPQPSWYGNWNYQKDDLRIQELPCFQYLVSAGELTERLELLGYTLDKSKEAWDFGVQETLQIASDYAALSQSDKPKLPSESGSNPQSSFDFWTRHYSKLTFKLWTELMQRIIVEKIEAIYRLDDKRKAEFEKTDPLLCYVLRGHGASAHEFGFPSVDFDLILRAMIELLDQDTPVVLDCSPLVDWAELDQYTCTPPKAVVLTEGSSDKRIIERSLKFLYPHLHGYFTFPDFEATNLQGSTGQLINITKAFAATGVRHKTIVLFDNDTAGQDALRVLSGIQLPGEIRVSALPDLDLATHYPTTGPQGNMEVNINGVACSIELYLGQDVLEGNDKRLCPVRFTGFVQSMGRWQGEIIKKQALQEKYLHLLEDRNDDHAIVASHDWNGMKLLLQMLFNLYSEASSYEA